jgi:hypothetical protein
MNNLKCLLKFAFLFLFLFQNNLNAATITANANGFWYNNIWSDIAGPQPGDNIIIPAGVKVTLNTLIDLSTPGNNVATTITVNGELIFTDEAISCVSNCEVGLKLDAPSVITVNNIMIINYIVKPIESPLGEPAAQNIYIGGDLILFSLPFGPGQLSSSGALLPVELIGFKGEVLSRSNELKWLTATEKNTSHFVVERSINGLDDYKVLGRVTARGFTTDVQTYLFEDTDINRMSYYRLNIIDFDGFSRYSDVIALERSKGVFEVEVFPNPVIKDVNVKVNLEKAGPVEIKIFDPSGKLVQRNIFDLEEGNNNVVFDMNGLNHQLYFINISYGNTTVSRKVMTTK